jgi:hypothetical protein
MKVYNLIAKDEKLDFANFERFVQKNKILAKKSIIE